MHIFNFHESYFSIVVVISCERLSSAFRVSNMASLADDVEGHTVLLSCGCRAPSLPRLITTFFVAMFVGLTITLIDSKWTWSLSESLYIFFFGMVCGLTLCVQECIAVCVCRVCLSRVSDGFFKGMCFGFLDSFLDPTGDSGTYLNFAAGGVAALISGIMWAVIGCIHQYIYSPSKVSLE